ncbi:cell wall hydrolase [Oceanibacterium hippocampi]|uniref:Spore cortex-lytic enzyme n=1 Tax=Oceanibacterium hippocampi TaxID=745714 RepID=A0A1Y5S4Q0_9PROT|nr:cell wall hydrolase [Oceanibacterium hippocampi]SLN32542.1 Spore cortex-lytic enzyme precursor [Oceanibacterium hippocampi]
MIRTVAFVASRFWRGFVVRPAQRTLFGGMLGCALVALASPAALADERVAPNDHELECLAKNIYFEARGEDATGKLAVAYVVMNRVADSRFPGEVCAVVKQGGEQRRHRCQFSWWCDGRSDEPSDWIAWEEAKDIALTVRKQRAIDPTDGALWYHAEYVQPSWRDGFARGRKIGRHIFYVRKDEPLTHALKAGYRTAYSLRRRAAKEIERVELARYFPRFD